MLGVTNLAFTAHWAIFVLFATGPMGLSDAGFGFMLTSTAFGGVAGSWAGPWLERRLGRARCLFLSITMFGPTLIVPALATNIPINVIAFVMQSFGSVVWNVITVSLRQRITPDRLLGRMNSAYRLLRRGTMPIGALIGGVIAEAFGLRPTFVFAAVLHIPLLLGFFVITDERIEAADTVAAT